MEFEKSTATTEQITEVIDPIINLMNSYLFTSHDAEYMARIFRVLHQMTIDALKEEKND